MKYGLFGKFTAIPGKRDELVVVLLQAAALLQENDDCIQYIVSTSDEPNIIWVNEIWNSKQAHEASLDPPDIKELIRTAMPLIASMSDHTEQHIVGGKGISL